MSVRITGPAENVANPANTDALHQYLVRGPILRAAVLVDQQKNRGAQDQQSEGGEPPGNCRRAPARQER